MKKRSTISRLVVCSLAVVALLLAVAPVEAAPLVSHWGFQADPTPNAGPWANEVAGGPDMAWDSATAYPGDWSPHEVRLNTDFSTTKSTRFEASDSSLNLSTFSFSLILDPTDLIDYGAILAKETNFAGGGGAWEQIGWEVQHTNSGNIEFAVRGNAGGYAGGIIVDGATSGLTAGGSWADPADYYQIAGGYDSVTGDAYLYVTKICTAYDWELGSLLPLSVSSLTGSTGTFATGYVQDNDVLSMGTKKVPAGYDGNGMGYDAVDLQIYNRLLTTTEILDLANNPGATIPEPTTGALLAVGMLLVGMRRRSM